MYVAFNADMKIRGSGESVEW